MFLRTVPPVVAAHSEWRSSKSFSLPLCFNDSASESDFTSASGTPIPHKVQMIIDSLCSTQSSDMSDQVQADDSALDLARQAGHIVNPRSTETLTRSRRTAIDCSKVASDCSDSDDSVDRGIEEAIQEYLKEKVDHQRKVEPTKSPLQPPKVSQRREADLPKQPAHSDSNKVLTASNHDQRGLKGVQPLAALKKKKKKKPSKENPLRKMDAAKAPSTLVVQKASSSCSPGADRTPPLLRVKEEVESPDSSSDDGIEEAIQRFQQEQKERHERSLHPREVLESSSDDGIEEAIQHYQQEKQKQEKHKVPSQSPLVAMQHDNVPILHEDCAGIQSHKKKNNRKKSATADGELKSASPKPLAVSNVINSFRVGGDAIRDDEPVAEKQIHSTLMVNTTAELMCAEAILDISKTVMPAVFEPSLNLAESAETEAPPLFSSGLPLPPDEKSNESSVDSEDGIEQEIRKFLELKAKMHEQSPVAVAEPTIGPTASKMAHKKKTEDDQSKEVRLSLSRKRKRKEDVEKSAKRQTDSILKEEPVTQPKSCKSKQNSPLGEHSEDSVIKDKGYSSPSNAPGFLFSQERNYSSDKSSSLDSDEDLESAIKDLLKTKKRVKKKVRDMKLKARKRLNLAQSPDTFKKQASATEQKSILVTNPAKSGKDLTSLKKLTKPKPLQTTKKPNTETVAGSRTTDPQPCVLDEDSSSVDSDDSIEQEIRRFLAEKAKVSSVLLMKEEDGGGGEEAAAFGKSELKTDDSLQAPTGTDPALLEETSKVPAALSRPDDAPATASEESPIPDTADKRTDVLLTRTLDEWRNGSLDAGADRASFREGTSSDPFVVGLSTQCQVQHQNLFLMKPENCSMTDAPVNFRDLPSGLQSRNRIPLREVLRTVCSSPVAKTPVSSPPEMPPVAKEDRIPSVTPESRTDSFYLHSRLKRPHWDQPPLLSPSAPHPQPTNLTPNTRHLSPHALPNPPHLSCTPLPPALSQPRITASVVRLRRDQAAVIPLSPHKTNHLQLRNRQGERERLDESREKEDEEKCIDETDVESGEEKRAEQQRLDKRQQRSSQSFSTSIDPGEMLSPYIALDTEQRRQKFRHIRQAQVMKGVKRKLRFMVSVPR